MLGRHPPKSFYIKNTFVEKVITFAYYELEWANQREKNAKGTQKVLNVVNNAKTPGDNTGCDKLTPSKIYDSKSFRSYIV